MLKDAGCTYVILGHSERRQLFGETDEGVSREGARGLDHGLIPIVCVGETLAEREASTDARDRRAQLERALRRLTPDEVARRRRRLRAGVGHRHRPRRHAAAGAGGARRSSASRWPRSHGERRRTRVRILYGGSVKPDNAAALMAQPDIDGALVGGACLQADSFLGIINFTAA